MMKKFNSLFLIMLLCLLPNLSRSQNCQVCTYTINSLDTNTYVLDSGKTLCIAPAGIISGKVILNGGEICNSGIFHPSGLDYNDGIFENYGDFYSPAPLIIKGNSRFVNRKGGKIKGKEVKGLDLIHFKDEEEEEKKEPK